MLRTVLTRATITAALLVGGTAIQAEQADTRAYAAMQACLAQATDVVDNGSYERFCIDRYLSSLQHAQN